MPGPTDLLSRLSTACLWLAFGAYVMRTNPDMLAAGVVAFLTGAVGIVLSVATWRQQGPPESLEDDPVPPPSAGLCDCPEPERRDGVDWCYRCKRTITARAEDS